MNKVFLGDCLVESDKIKSGSVDLILTDLPYGNMNTDGGRKMGINGWDLAIEPKKVYEIANRILRKNGKMILFSQEPYTSRLINESIPNVPFCYRATWEKDNFANALGCNKAMVGFTEDILVFSKIECYNAKHPLTDYAKKVLDFINLPMKEINKAVGRSRFLRVTDKDFKIMKEETYRKLNNYFGVNKMPGFKTFEELKEIDKEFKNQYASTFNLWEGNKYKSNILKYKKDYEGLHPTQKPVLLLEDLIKTFSNEGDLVVDLTAGSGSTAIAALKTKRNYIVIEKEVEYYDTIINRIKTYHHQPIFF